VLVLSQEGSIRVLLAGLVQDGDERSRSRALPSCSHTRLDRAHLVIIEAVAWDGDVLVYSALGRDRSTRIALVFSAHTVLAARAVGTPLFAVPRRAPARPSGR
jgi:hypothetical protein